MGGFIAAVKFILKTDKAAAQEWYAAGGDGAARAFSGDAVMVGGPEEGAIEEVSAGEVGGARGGSSGRPAFFPRRAVVFSGAYVGKRMDEDPVKVRPEGKAPKKQALE